MTAVIGWEKQGGAAVFLGTIDEIKSQGSRSGHTLHITARGVDTKGKAKEPQQKHMDDMDTEQALNEAGKAAGISVRVDPALNKKRDYWAMNDESFIAFGERIAQELGGVL